MWLLKRLDTGFTVHLLCNTDYKIGAAQDHRDLPLDDHGKVDKSISRKHAVIGVNYTEEDQEHVNRKGQVYILDLESKYGTFINDGIDTKTRMDKNQEFILRENDKVRFGLQWNVWQLSYVPLIVLIEPDLKAVQKPIFHLGGHVVESWSNEVTHFTTSAITMTTTVICALGRGIPIVIPEYWHSLFDIVGKVKEGAVTRLPNPKRYLPAVKEVLMENCASKFVADVERRNTFKGKIFIFPSCEQFDTLSTAVVEAGGKAENLSDTKLSLKEICSSDNMILIQMKTSPESQSQDQSVTDKYEKLLAGLTSLKKRAIPQGEISLSVLYKTVETHCNPMFHPKQLIRPRKDSIPHKESTPQEILAPDTQDTQPVSMPMPSMLSTTTTTKKRSRVPESVESDMEVLPDTGITFDHSEINTHQLSKKQKVDSTAGEGITFRDDDRFLSNPKPTQKTLSPEVKKIDDTQSTSKSEEHTHLTIDDPGAFGFENVSTDKSVTTDIQQSSLEDSQDIVVNKRSQKRVPLIDSDSDEDMMDEPPVKKSKNVLKENDAFAFPGHKETTAKPQSEKPTKIKSPKEQRRVDAPTEVPQIKTLIETQSPPNNYSQSSQEDNDGGWLNFNIKIEKREPSNSEDDPIPNLIIRRVPLVNVNQSAIINANQNENTLNASFNVKLFKKILHPDISGQLPSIISSLEMVRFQCTTGEKVTGQEVPNDEPLENPEDWEYHDMDPAEHDKEFATV